MPTKKVLLITACIIASLAFLGCNLPAGTPSPDLSGTIVASTLGALQTSVSLTQAHPGFEDTPTLTVLSTLPPIGVATTAVPVLPGQNPLNPLVTADALCWVGPGNQYEVVSAILKGNRVELLGRGTIPGWYIVRNPIYRDPCWIPANVLEIPTGTDLSGLPYFSPPASPTPTPTNTPTNAPTKTPTPTNTPP